MNYEQELANKWSAVYWPLLCEYREVWHLENPGYRGNAKQGGVCANPSSLDWEHFALTKLAHNPDMDEFEKKVWMEIARNKSIIHQFLASEFGDEGIIICEDCNVNISNFYDEGASCIESNQCPICNCEHANYSKEYDDNSDEDADMFERCEHCNQNCDRREHSETRSAYWSHIDDQIKMAKEDRDYCRY
jgi:hypothetical protein